MSAEVYIAQGKIDEAEQILSEAEKNLKIDEILLYPQMQVKLNENDDIKSCIRIALICIKSNKYENLEKAEKILKYLEGVKNINFYVCWVSKANIYCILGDLYYAQGRFRESKINYEKSLDIYKQHMPDMMGVKLLYQRLTRLHEIEKLLKYNSN